MIKSADKASPAMRLMNEADAVDGSALPTKLQELDGSADKATINHPNMARNDQTRIFGISYHTLHIMIHKGSVQRHLYA